MTTVVASEISRMIIYIELELKESAAKLAKRQQRSVSSLVCLLQKKAINDAQEGHSDDQ